LPMSQFLYTQKLRHVRQSEEIGVT